MGGFIDFTRRYPTVMDHGRSQGVGDIVARASRVTSWGATRDACAVSDAVRCVACRVHRVSRASGIARLASRIECRVSRVA
ncbi:MAG TPA: hypothetical protein DEA59_13540, partial [Microbacterium sp.]|nr:hypothetical protein [Microbacterium sp.]HBR90258.1 hypothetical protein [Microbacterium sp.]